MKKGPPIMVVDDDPDVRRMLCMILEDEGYATIAAADGVEALDSMRRETPALVIVDLMMPRMDGEGLMSRMRDEPPLNGIPIVIMSGQTKTSEVLQRATARLLKPVELDDVLSLCDRYAGGGASRAQMQ